MKSIAIACVASIASIALIAPSASAQQPPPRKHVQETVKPSPKQAWKKGGKVSNPKGRQQVNDYHKRGLSTPKKGQHWVKVDNQYLLITAATGVILSIANGR